MDFWKTLFAAGIIAGSLTASATTNFYAHASTAETNVFLGQVFTVDVIVKAPEIPDTPDVGPLEGFNMTILNAGSATSETNTYLFRYAFRATQEGALTIPALSFLAQEEMVATKPLGISARKPEATDRMKLETTLTKQSVYLGEPVLLKTTWNSTYQFGALKAVDFNFPILNDKRFQTLEPYEPEKEKNAQTTGLPVHGTRVLASRKNYKEEEVQHQSLSFSKILIPKKVGKLVIQPSTLLCAAEKEKDPSSKQGRRTAFQYPSYFDNTFFDQNLTDGDYTRTYTESTPIELDVKPLPSTNRPALFNGMVGDYTIEVAAEPSAVRVGEPVTLTITITAAEFMENIFFQPLRYQPLLINRFEIPVERSLPQRSGKSKIYTQTIRPLSTNIAAVPPIQMAYFSATSNAYITTRSAPVPLQVSPAENISAFGMDDTPHRSRLRTVKEGILHNYEKSDMLESRRLPVFGWAHPALVILILLLPPLLVGGLWLISLFGEKKHHIHRTAKAARAYKTYRKNAAHIIHSHSMKSEIYGGLDQVLRAYLGDRLHLNPGALTFRDAQGLLTEAGADPKTLEELERLFALCETYRFTVDYNESADAKQIVHGANRIVKAVERNLK
jgi:hypothetical protein